MDGRKRRQLASARGEDNGRSASPPGLPGAANECFFVLLCPALAEHIVFVVSVPNGSQLTGVPWDLRLAGHTSATHTFLVSFVLSILSRVHGNITYSEIHFGHSTRDKK